MSSVLEADTLTPRPTSDLCTVKFAWFLCVQILHWFVMLGEVVVVVVSGGYLALMGLAQRPDVFKVLVIYDV